MAWIPLELRVLRMEAALGERNSNLQPLKIEDSVSLSYLLQYRLLSSLMAFSKLYEITKQ
jgi:hypothetical protein